METIYYWFMASVILNIIFYRGQRTDNELIKQQRKNLDTQHKLILGLQEQKRTRENIEKDAETLTKTLEYIDKRDKFFREYVSDIFKAAPSIRNEYIRYCQENGKLPDDMFLDIAMSLDEKSVN